ncbi:hypothetical protein BSL78_02126 [Apostichopus japonicus]|uniref:Uncharacterized protein n=1 Tax=Stichopus japonicus TaxID=307972 RepID=A0A2G8LL18_STIJA|nr:hypothetical protein BSL78_02126 [Apostichopus japonicus]
MISRYIVDQAESKRVVAEQEHVIRSAPHVDLHTPPSLTDAENLTEEDEGSKGDRDREELKKEKDENEEPPEVQETANLVVYLESNPADGIPEVLSEDEDERDQELDEFYIKVSQSYSSPVCQELQDEQLCNPNDPDTDTLGEETSSSVSEDGDFLAPLLNDKGLTEDPQPKTR